MQTNNAKTDSYPLDTHEIDELASSELDDCTSPRLQHEHCYFLNRDTAYKTALQRNVVAHEDNKILQHCYYDGTEFENAPDHLINVRVQDFTEYFANNDLPLPSFLCCDNSNVAQQEVEQMQSAFSEIIEEVRGIRKTLTSEETSVPQYEHTDTYFFDAKQAFMIALQQNRVFCGHPTIDGLQLCFYDGDPIPDAPPNLINVRFENILDFFLHTRLRLPESIGFPSHATLEQKEEITQLYQQVVEEVRAQRQQNTRVIAAAIMQQHPEFNTNEPLRIFFPSSRLTTVMQYASKNLARAFEKLGHKTWLSMEQNDMEGIDMSHRLAEFYQFEPHVVVNINHLYNSFLNPHIYNITWWQDAMPEITQSKPITWRERDLVYSAVSQLDTYLEACGASRITRQPFCIDTDEFTITDNKPRENKIIFIGSSYLRHLQDHERHKEALNALSEHFEAGDAITGDVINQIADDNNMSRDYVFWHLFHYVIRDYSVRWLCQNSPIPVEVYGPDWEYDPIVKPYHKGKLRHGADVVEAYNSALYALVVHPFELNSQRLAEASACGCIPVVYDCRHSSDQPHWDNDILYYKTRDDLVTILSQQQGKPAPHIAEHYSYDRFAKHILETINNP